MYITLHQLFPSIFTCPLAHRVVGPFHMTSTNCKNSKKIFQKINQTYGIKEKGKELEATTTSIKHTIYYVGFDRDILFGWSLDMPIGLARLAKLSAFEAFKVPEAEV